MGYFENITADLDQSPYTTQQGDPENGMDVELVEGDIVAWSDITSLLTLPADYEDLSISMLDGSVLSVYGFDVERTVVMLYAEGPSNVCMCFKYGNATDYEAGKALLTPAAELRAP
jgi:hypothetical protein